MILTGGELRRLISLGRLKVDPLYPDTVRENGLDLRIGGEYAIYAYEGAVVRPCELESTRHLFRVVKAEEVVIPPRSFVLLTTEEYVKMP
jgi:dCTP deaminase